METLIKLANKYQAKSRWAKISSPEDRKTITDIYNFLHGSHHIPQKYPYTDYLNGDIDFETYQSHLGQTFEAVEFHLDGKYIHVRIERLPNISDNIYHSFFTYSKTL